MTQRSNNSRHEMNNYMQSVKGALEETLADVHVEQTTKHGQYHQDKKYLT